MLKSKSILIISDSSKRVGLGHYSRSKYLTHELKGFFKKKIRIKNIFYQNDFIINDNNHIKFSFKKNFVDRILHKIRILNPSHIIFNVSKKFENRYLKSLLNQIKKFKQKKILVAIDGCIKLRKSFNSIWIPNIYLDKEKKYQNILYGWDKILFKRLKKNKIKYKKKILILIGGTDVYNYSSKLPKILRTYFDENYSIKWIQGPFAKKPKIKNYKNFEIIKNKSNIEKEILSTNLVLVLFGVSFFEVAALSKPCVVLIPSGKEKKELIKKISKKGFNVANNIKTACKKLYDLSQSYNDAFKKANYLSSNLNKKNRKELYKRILSL